MVTVFVAKSLGEVHVLVRHPALSDSSRPYVRQSTMDSHRYGVGVAEPRFGDETTLLQIVAGEVINNIILYEGISKMERCIWCWDDEEK